MIIVFSSSVARPDRLPIWAGSSWGATGLVRTTSTLVLRGAATASEECSIFGSPPGGTALSNDLAAHRFLRLRCESAPEGGWGLHGVAHSNADLVAAARAEIATLTGP